MTNTQLTTIACLTAVLSWVGPGRLWPTGGDAKTQKLSSYAEFKKGDTLIVDGQRVVSAAKVKKVTEIPLGYEVKLKGHRNEAGTFIAEHVEAKANTADDSEKEIIASSD